MHNYYQIYGHRKADSKAVNHKYTLLLSGGGDVPIMNNAVWRELLG